MSNHLIYTVVTNNYDKVKPVIGVEGFDFWLFTDQEDLKIEGWETKVLPKSENPIKQQRLLKINSCEFTTPYELTIYMDGNMEIIQNPQKFLDKFFRGGFLTCEHPKRSSLAEEAKEILRKKKDLPENVERTLNYAKAIGYQDDLGLFETMVLVRDKSPEVRALEESWAKILSEYSHRDQLSLPIASYLTKVPIHIIERTELFKYIKRNRGHHISLKFRKKGEAPSSKLDFFKWLGLKK
ncbi:glycosyltransferase domain-containing protein [Algoriphagus limi]|uniref:DUF616 domain-containing protein n=1 Tax=Algoriphagus limi TaxID=2975273 RepID=A0ABT2GDC1_9BACT|nr:glycosyltransferase domain-containing protein [Algoriphagus limi]MCS5491965.1 DUF616 domain-containing protein [Algoriphagus limi]